MSGERGICGEHTLDCTCEGDYRESYQHMNQYWSQAMIDRKFTHLGARLKPLDEDGFGGIDPPAEALPRKWIDVKGRVEHEALLKDPEKMASLGLDPFYEVMVYLSRWGGWLEDEDKSSS